jgi:hypothetical protein
VRAYAFPLAAAKREHAREEAGMEHSRGEEAIASGMFSVNMASERQRITSRIPSGPTYRVRWMSISVVFSSFYRSKMKWLDCWS